MNIDTISFDLDNTLCRYKHTPEQVLSDSFDTVGIEPMFDLDAYVGQFDTFAEDAPDMASLRRRCFAHLADEAGYDPAVGEAVAEAYNSQRESPEMVWRDGMDQLFESMTAEYSVVVVTNGLPDAQKAKLESLDILEDLDGVVYGGGTHPRKPDPTPFHVALESVDATPEQAVHIGNSLEHDVAGANRAGLTSVWFPDHSWRSERPEDVSIEPDFQVLNADELREIPWIR